MRQSLSVCSRAGIFQATQGHVGRGPSKELTSFPFLAWEVESIFSAPLPVHCQSRNAWPGAVWALWNAVGLGSFVHARARPWIMWSSLCTQSGLGMQRLLPPGAKPQLGGQVWRTLVLKMKCVLAAWAHR